MVEEALPPLPDVKDEALFFANRGLEPIYAPQRVLDGFAALAAQWPQARLIVANDGSLRPAVEDLWGAGAVLAALEDFEWPGLSPEAAVAADAYRLVREREEAHLRASASGEELVAAGWEADVEVAAQVGASTVVPVLSDRGFVAAP